MLVHGYFGPNNVLLDHDSFAIAAQAPARWTVTAWLGLVLGQAAVVVRHGGDDRLAGLRRELTARFARRRAGAPLDRLG